MWARRLHRWSRRRDSNPEPAVYKTAALPIELRRRGAWAPKGCRKRPRMIGPAEQGGQAAPAGRRFRRGGAGSSGNTASTRGAVASGVGSPSDGAVPSAGGHVPSAGGDVPSSGGGGGSAAA